MTLVEVEPRWLARNSKAVLKSVRMLHILRSARTERWNQVDVTKVILTKAT